jgi:antitoxin component YwqK of YwqJK toxin-antitoxin module
VDYYRDGTKQHQVTYKNGRKTGKETFWSPDGKKIWRWQRDLKNNRGIWTHYWPNGKKKTESEWNINPEARDLKRHFFGYVTEGPSRHWNEQGELVASYHFVSGTLAESEPSSQEGDK